MQTLIQLFLPLKTLVLLKGQLNLDIEFWCPEVHPSDNDEYYWSMITLHETAAQRRGLVAAYGYHFPWLAQRLTLYLASI